MANKKTYTDIDFGFSKNKFTSDLNLIYDTRAINQSIKNIVSTMLGEKSFSPKFGVGLTKLLFESDHQNLFQAAGDILQSLNTYENRIKVQSVKPKKTDNDVSIVITYKYRDKGVISTTQTTVNVNISSGRYSY
jgi:phage baseplate assembly protein W|tara:strand:+ start:49 stop:450 length:402 start_codon:yes stop_codon:yes gene_type:complete